MANLNDVVRLLDATLRVAEIPDDPGAVNGLQLEAGDRVTSVALAVDAGEATLAEACARGADLLVVHHGLLWGGNRPLTGPHGRKLKRCFEAGLSVYAAHLPLDVHPELGNNAGLVRALGLHPDGTFGKYQGLELGLTAPCDLAFAELQARLAPIGPVRWVGRGPERIRRVGVLSGSGGSFLSSAARAGVDALITGEGPHHSALEAEERGLHLALAGHYRTETFGVRALGPLLERHFGLPSVFLEHDTGL